MPPPTQPPLITTSRRPRAARAAGVSRLLASAGLERCPRNLKPGEGPSGGFSVRDELVSVYVSGHEESQATGVVFVTIPEGLRTALAALRDAGYSVKQGEGSVLAAWKPDREGGVIRPPDYGAFMERLTVQRERAETRSPNSRERRRSLARMNHGA